MAKFKAAEFGEQFSECLKRYKEIVKDSQPKIDEKWKRLQSDLTVLKKRGFLTVAFIGEYNAGKSTIISALTNRKDIKISADIETDKTSEYDWNAIKLIDTPGLWTHRKDHDKITYEAIQRSDLLVFSITHSLFDAITIENFKELAYELNYRRKMLLVVNKTSEESGENETKIKNYTESIVSAIAPYDASEFPICFIDACDFIDGKEEGDEELIIMSRFDTFFQALNKFIEDKETLAKLDTPIRIFIGNLSEAVNLFSQEESSDNVYLEILNRLSKVIIKERERLSIKVNNISMILSSKVVDEGVTLAGIIGGEENFEAQCKAAEVKIQKLSEEASAEMQQAAEEAAEELHNKVKEVYKSPLTEHFYMHFEQKGHLEVSGVDQDESFKKFKEKTDNLSSIAEEVGLEITRQTTEGAAKSAAGGLFKASEVAGSNLHNLVFTVGKFFGVNFKPWQAVNLAKTIGNVAKVVGPILAIISLILEGYEQVKEDEREVKLSDARREINLNFLAMADNFERQFKKQFKGLCEELYGPVEREITHSRVQEEEKIAQENEHANELLSLRHTLDELLNEIYT